MEKTTSIYLAPRKKQSRPGFALIVTIALMLLMAVIVVGILSLAISTVRASAAGNSRALAEANARLALVMAIGELQKNLGPDQRISAPASLVKNNPAEPNLVGAWDSWSLDPNSPDYSEKKNKFRRWLVSTASAGEAKNIDLPTGALTKRVILTKALNPGGGNPAGLKLNAGLVSVTSGNGIQGGYAYAVMDESLKARVNLAKADPKNTSEELAERIAPRRDRPEAIVPELAPDSVGDPSRLVTLPTAELAAKTAGAATDSVLGHGQDLTANSISLLTDTVNGGLKKDLTTAFESDFNLAAADAFGSETVYYSAADGAPLWDYLRNHYREYRRVTNTSSGKPQVNLDDRELTPETTAQGRGYDVAPATERLLPVIAKMQIVFSIVGHHNHLGNRVNYYNTNAGKLKNKDFAVPHLAYDPVVTLYNPYDVALELPQLRLRVSDPPVLFGFKKNGVWFRPDFKNGVFHGLARFQIINQNNPNARKSFTLSLSEKESKDKAGAPITMQPGEVKVFSPLVESYWTWGYETRGGYTPWVFFDWEAGRDFANKDPRNGGNPYGVYSVPGWDVRAGLQTDHLAQNGARGPTQYAFEAKDNVQDGFVNIKLDDTVGVHAEPGRTVNESSSPDFEVDILAGENENVEKDYLRSYTFRYADVAAHLAESLPSDGINRQFLVGDILQAPGDRSVGGKSPFALLTMSAKTTAMANDYSMPWLHNNPVTEGTNQDTRTIGDALDTYDLSLKPMTDFQDVDIDPDTNRGYYGAGITSSRGVSNVPMFRVPLIPAAGLGDLIAANLTASGALPRVTHAFGNSRAHPLIPGNAVKRQSPVSGAGLMLDHSYLLNAALWDSTFFSTVADFQGELIPNTGRATLLKEFLAGKRNLLNPRLVPLSGNGKPSKKEASDLDGLADKEFMNQIAAHMAVRGGFNINSDSVPAWKAMLASLRDEAVRGWKNQEFNKDKEKTAFPRAGLPLAGDAEGSESASIDVQGAVRWAGFRALTDAQIETLAQKIVAQSRARARNDGAPFLSLGEFVNRRVGSSSEIQSMAGVLATAIDESGINSGSPFDQDTKTITGSEALPPGALKGMAEPEARIGKTALGAPPFISQGDLLTPMSTVITPRGDTFRIRAYGEARNGNNEVVKVWCEAIVQRMPEYLDPSDRADKKTDALNPVNKTFGRRFIMTSFRWLSPKEL